MKNRGLFILLGLVIMVSAYAGYDYWSEQHEVKQKDERTRLVKFDKDQIQDVILTRGQEKIHLHRSQDGWQITEPLQETADQNAAAEFVDGITFEKSVDLVKQGDGIDWKIFGLESPQAILTVINNAGAKQEFAISTQKNYVGDYYVHPLGQNQIFTVSSSWNLKAQKKVLDFRDRRLLKKASAAVKTIHVSRRGVNLHLEKKDSVWFSPDQKSWKLDQTKINEVSSMLSTTQGVDIVREGPIQTADLKAYALVKPDLSLELQLQNGGTWRADFSIANSKREVFVHTSDPDRILQVQPSEVLKFQNLSLDFLRDRHEIFTLDRDRVQTLELVDAGRELKADHHSDHWTITSSHPEAKGDGLSNFLVQMRNTDVVDFDLSPEQLQKAASESHSSLQLKDEKGQPVMALRWGYLYEKKSGATGKKLLAIQNSALGPAWYGIDAARLSAWGLDSLWPAAGKKDDHP